jgi:hypothetical protein
MRASGLGSPQFVLASTHPTQSLSWKRKAWLGDRNAPHIRSCQNPDIRALTRIRKATVGLLDSDLSDPDRAELIQRDICVGIRGWIGK